ncbi:MAG: PQQ-binding-like beta-propeller repeat protein [Thermoguttaceae bacterium]
MPSLFGVAPVLIGPLQVLLALLPALVLSLLGALVALFRPRVIRTGLKVLWRQKAATAVVVALAGLAVYGRTLLSGPAAAVSSEEREGQDWPMFRGDLKRRGASGAVEEPAHGGVQWSFTDGCKTFYATPAAVGNRIYVASADKGPLRDRGAIYCLDADTGNLVWKSAPRGYLATFSSPVISGKYLVCGEGLHTTRNARVVCLDVSQAGKVLWTYETHSHVETTPCIDGDRVYLGAGKDGYYCLRLEPDAAGQPVVVWHVPGEKLPDAETSPAVRDGRVYVNLGRSIHAVVCLDAATGDEIWRVAAPYSVFGAPMLMGDVVFVGMGNGNFIQSAEEVRAVVLEKLKKQGKSASELAAAAKDLGPAGEVWCLDARTGEVKWKFHLGQTVLGATAGGRDRLYFASRDGFVYCLSLAGKVLAKWNAHAPMVTSPALAGNHVYVVTETGKLYGLRADDLELAWEATLGLTGPFVSSPTVARGHVYVGSAQDGLLCLGQPGGVVEEPRWAGQAGGPGQGGNLDGQPIPEKGNFAWQFPEDEGDAAGQLGVSAPPACLGQFLFVPVHGSRNGVVCLRDDPKGNRAAVELWHAPSAHGVRLSPAADARSVWFVDGQKGDAGRHLWCVDAAQGKSQWKLPVADAASGEFLIIEGGGLIASRADGLTHFDRAGAIVWQRPLGQVRGVPACTDDIAVVAIESPPSLAALDLPSGSLLWRVSLAAAPTAGPVIHKRALYVGTPQGIAAFSLVRGELLWQNTTGQPGSDLALGREWIACVNTGGQLVLVRPEDGGLAKTIAGDFLPNVPPLVVRNVILLGDKTGLLQCGPDAVAALWMRTDWLGKLTSAPVMANSRVYFGTGTCGLVCAQGKETR